MKLVSLIFSVLFFFVVNLFSQTPEIDKLFQQAKTEAFANNYSNARKICYQILQKNNKYDDARILLARTFSWEQKYDSARFHLNKVLANDAYSLDAYLALADVETWSKNCSQVLILCDSALAKIPNNYDLLIKKTKACLCKEDAVCARSTIDDILKVYPMNLEVQNLLKQIQTGKYKNRIIVEHSYEHFIEPYLERWHVTSLQYQRDGKWGTAIAKVNAGQLIQSSGKLFDPGSVQYEADFYPILGKGFYGYLNYGYSDGELFPMHRAGIELFKTFPKGFEASLGGRFLYYNEFSNVKIYTASLSKYIGKWWFSARPYISYSMEEWNQSYFLFARRYSNQYNYLGGMLGYGLSPDFIPNLLGSFDVYHLNSYQVRLDVQQRLATHFLLRGLAGFAYDQYDSKEYRNRFNFQLYLAYMF